MELLREDDPRMRQGLAGTCRVLTPRLQLKRLTILSARRDLSQADRMTEHGRLKASCYAKKEKTLKGGNRHEASASK